MAAVESARPELIRAQHERAERSWLRSTASGAVSFPQRFGGSIARFPTRDAEGNAGLCSARDHQQIKIRGCLATAKTVPFALVGFYASLCGCHATWMDLCGVGLRLEL